VGFVVVFVAWWGGRVVGVRSRLGQSLGHQQASLIAPRLEIRAPPTVTPIVEVLYALFGRSSPVGRSLVLVARPSNP
jgi:hypothetical protein